MLLHYCIAHALAKHCEHFLPSVMFSWNVSWYELLRFSALIVEGGSLLFFWNHCCLREHCLCLPSVFRQCTFVHLRLFDINLWKSCRPLCFSSFHSCKIRTKALPLHDALVFTIDLTTWAILGGKNILCWRIAWLHLWHFALDFGRQSSSSKLYFTRYVSTLFSLMFVRKWTLVCSPKSRCHKRYACFSVSIGDGDE